MDRQRRMALKAGGGIGLYGAFAALGLLPGTVSAQADRALFEAENLDAALSALGMKGQAASADLAISAPDVAENGAMVPIGVTSRLAGTDRIVILVEKNPNVVVADFTVPPGTLPEIQTRVKMAESSPVFALVRANGVMHMARRDVRVTVGGCAG